MFKKVMAALVALAGSTVAAYACPNYNMVGVEAYEASGNQLRSGAAFNVVAGGQNYIFSCPAINPGTDRGAGYFTTQADFSFYLSNMGGHRLALSVISECDSALLINTGAVNWYYDDDDNGNLDPRITLTRPSNGRIDVWVGTYDGEYCNATLYLQTY